MIRSKVAYFVFASVACLCLTSNSFAQGYFYNQYGGPGGYGYWDNFGLAQGDFNQDGRIDFVVSEQISGGYPGVGIYLAQADGSYQLSQNIALTSTRQGADLFAIAVGDLNGDHIPDIVCVDADTGNVYAILGNGDGTFQPAVTTTGGPTGAASAALGDFNRDGKADLVISSSNQGQVYVMLSNGDGSFGSPTLYTAGSIVSQVITADFNADGKLDLATANYGDGTVSVLLGNGDGTFNAATKYGVGQDVECLAAGDLNGDKKLDIVAGVAYNGGAHLEVLLGNGDGTFQSSIETSTTTIPRAIFTADFNGDGKMDVVVAGFNPGTTVFLGTGTGSFRANPETYGPELGWGDGPHVLVVGDYNLDGKPDFAVLPVVSPLAFEIFTNNGDGTFLNGHTLNAGKGTYGVIANDFNNDNKADLVAINSGSNNVSLFLGNANGTFQVAKVYAVGSDPRSAAVGDFNGDGYQDLAVANYGDGTVSVLLNNGNGTFKKQVKYSVGQFPRAIAVADLRNDGKLDLVIGTSSSLVVLLGNGDGTFQAATAYGSGNAYYALAIADFNGDGNLDVAAVTGASFDISILFGNGDGGFGTSQLVSFWPMDQIQSVAAGNLRGFGVQDIVVGGSCCAGGVGVLLNNGDGTFQPISIASTGAIGQATSVILADVNGDSYLDAVVSGNPGISVLLGGGNGALSPDMIWYGASGTGIGVGVGPNGVAVGDFNGDGTLDIAAVNYKGSSVNGSLSLFLSNPVAAFSSSSLNFGGVKVGSNSMLNLTLTNQSPTTLAVSGISIIGTGATDYSQTNTCGTSVSNYANCTVTVTFTPLTKGAHKASLKFTDSAVGPARTIPLSGTGK